MEIDWSLTIDDLQEAVRQCWEVAAPKALRLLDPAMADGGTPVMTRGGKYAPQGWTEWTRGFQFGLALLVYDATGRRELLDAARERIWAEMRPHVTHFGVHDHGFNVVSTYGHLWRLAHEGLLSASSAEVALYEMALAASGSVQAARWSPAAETGGYIYSFNGPQSLFCDTIRSLRSLAVAHRLGQWLWTENDQKVSLLERLIQHAQTTATWSVFYGEQRDIYDERGRVAHESLFNTLTGHYRCPSTQQGYSPFTTWTRGLAWIMLGYAEQLEFVNELEEDELEAWGGLAQVDQWMLRAAQASCDFYIDHTSLDGLPYWDTGAPGLVTLGDYRRQPADPFNDVEPVDSSAAAIACQGLLRLGDLLTNRGQVTDGNRYWQAGLTVLRRLLESPYFSRNPEHEGLLLHSVYHRPRGWDALPPGSPVPHSESSLWGDYHLAEAALYVQRWIADRPAYHFYNGLFDC